MCACSASINRLQDEEEKVKARKAALAGPLADKLKLLSKLLVSANNNITVADNNHTAAGLSPCLHPPRLLRSIERATHGVRKDEPSLPAAAIQLANIYFCSQVLQQPKQRRACCVCKS